MAEKQIHNFVGLKYTSGDLEVGSACLKPGRSVFLGSDTILCGALALGFDSSIMTTLNICPELSIQIFDLMNCNQLNEAKKVQKQLTQRVTDILIKGNNNYLQHLLYKKKTHFISIIGDWVVDMKREFNSIRGAAVGLNAGPTRKPELGLK